MSDELEDLVHEGDSIIKIKDKNLCILKHNRRIDTIPYIYLSKECEEELGDDIYKIDF